MKKYSVLILNLDLQPYDIWEWEHAMTKLLCKNCVEPVYDENGVVKYDKVIRDGQGNEYELPAVLVLNTYRSAHNGLAPYSKRNIYARDLEICQYCGKKVREGDLTIDHVIPRDHWNPRRFSFRLSSFENVVTACGACNKKKANRTPRQANMSLIPDKDGKPKKPRTITRAQAYANKRALLAHNEPDQWKPFLKELDVKT
jgi:hypothetical protein